MFHLIEVYPVFCKSCHQVLALCLGVFPREFYVPFIMALLIAFRFIGSLLLMLRVELFLTYKVIPTSLVTLRSGCDCVDYCNDVDDALDLGCCVASSVGFLLPLYFGTAPVSCFDACCVDCVDCCGRGGGVGFFKVSFSFSLPFSFCVLFEVVLWIPCASSPKFQSPYLPSLWRRPQCQFHDPSHVVR